MCDSLFRSLSWDRARCIKSRLDESRGATLLRVCPSQYPPRPTLLFKVDQYQMVGTGNKVWGCDAKTHNSHGTVLFCHMM